MFLDMPLASGQSLRDLTIPELINIAKRAEHGPEMWSRPPDIKQTFTRQTFLSPDIIYDGKSRSEGNKAKLLPGGKWVLFTSFQSAVLECWNVAEDILRWEHTGQEGVTSFSDFSAQVVDGGLAVIIVIGFRVHNRDYQEPK